MVIIWVQNGLFHNLNEDGTDSNGLLTNGALNIADELTDLRRQVIFLQGQLEDKDRAIQNLQLQVAKQQDLINSVDSQSSISYASSSKDMSNAATQTEKVFLNQLIFIILLRGHLSAFRNLGCREKNQ